jgi:hypothetical protein
MATTYDKIASTTLGSATSPITFTSIPSTYTDLRLIFVGTWTSSNALRTHINNTTSGSLYSYTDLQGDGATAGSFRSTSSNSIQMPSSCSTTLPTFVTMDFFSYAGSTNKTVLIEISQDYNGSGVVQRSVALFRNTAAITRLDLTAVGTTFAIGTTATLYGILKA